MRAAWWPPRARRHLERQGLDAVQQASCLALSLALVAFASIPGAASCGDRALATLLAAEWIAGLVIGTCWCGLRYQRTGADHFGEVFVGLFPATFLVAAVGVTFAAVPCYFVLSFAMHAFLPKGWFLVAFSIGDTNLFDFLVLSAFLVSFFRWMGRLCQRVGEARASGAAQAS